MEQSSAINIDYKSIGLKSGLEIHQQLDTGKLFCRCPSILRQDKPDFTVKRKIHAVAGETGEIDVAAAYEMEREREFIYEGYNDTTCEIELDEAPPREIDKEALHIALRIAKLLNADILPVAQVMRKTVVDGSNTSGFQRTVLIARNGHVETEYGPVRIDTVALEEDAARISGTEGKEAKYRLDRLGIPLIEIATAPDMNNPEQVKQVALHIGDVLRACKVKRGIGTIRQDVNVSIKGHDRVELKGVQEPKLITKSIESEIQRQQEDIRQGKTKGEVRKANPDGTTSFQRPMPGAARMYPETDLPLIRITREMIISAGKELPKTRKEIAQELKVQGLSDEMIKLVIESDKLALYKSLVAFYKNPNLIAKLILVYPVQIGKKMNLKDEEIEAILTEDIFEHLLAGIKSGEIQEADIHQVIENLLAGKELKEAMKIEKAKTEDIEEAVLNIIKEKPGLSENAYMGLVMQKFKGRLTGGDAMRIIKKLINKKN